MEKVLKYSVLRYSPSSLSGEKINLGILFFEEVTNYRSFYFTRNLRRIKKFDDELNISVLKDFLTGIQEEVEEEQFENKFDIDTFIKYYINNYVFDTPHTVLCEDLNDMVDRLIKAYFRFDFTKSERPDKKADQKIIASLIGASGVNLKKNQKIIGMFEESIAFDIVTDDYYVKLFDFDDKDLKRCINTAKTWAWNCMHEHKKPIYIVYRFSAKDHSKDVEFSIIRNIFSEANAKFISMDDIHVFQKAN